MLKLNLGSGPVQPVGWVNVDGSIRARIASKLSWLDQMMVRLGVWPPTEFSSATVNADLLKPLPWTEGSAQHVYLGEVLEHFTPQDGERLLRECHRVLASGGILRLRVPDNVQFWRNYVREFDEAYAKPRAQWTENHSRWVEMFFHDICVKRTMFVSYGHFHKWMYDEISLIRLLERVGFTNVARRAFQESAIPDVAAVEARSDLIVEATKP